MLALMGQCDEAIDLVQHAVRLSPDALGTAAATMTAGLCYTEKGDCVSAISALEYAVQALAEFGFRQLHGMATAWLADAYLANGEVERAHEVATQAWRSPSARRFRTPWAARSEPWAAPLINAGTSRRPTPDCERRSPRSAVTT